MYCLFLTMKGRDHCQLERHHGILCKLKKGEFGKSEKTMTGRVMGGVIWGKGQKGKGQGCFKPICAADKRISWEFSSK